MKSYADVESTFINSFSIIDAIIGYGRQSFFVRKNISLYSDYQQQTVRLERAKISIGLNANIASGILVVLVMAEFVEDKAVFASDEDIKIRVKVKSRVKIENCRVNIGIYDTSEAPIGSYSSDAFFKIGAGEEKLLEYTIKKPNLALGSYSIAFSVGMGNAAEGETNLDVIHHVLTFEIDKLSKEKNLYFVKWDSSWGVMRFEAEMKEL